MTRLKKVQTIAVFEFLSTVKRKSYLIATFGMPLFVILYAGIISLVQFVIEERDSRPRIYGIVDPSGVINLEGDQELADMEFPESVRQALEATGNEDLVDSTMTAVGSSIFRPFQAEPEAREALLGGELRGYFLIASDYMSSGKVEEYRAQNGNLNQSGPIRALRSLLQKNLLKATSAKNSLNEFMIRSGHLRVGPSIPREWCRNTRPGRSWHVWPSHLASHSCYSQP